MASLARAFRCPRCGRGVMSMAPRAMMARLGPSMARELARPRKRGEKDGMAKRSSKATMTLMLRAALGVRRTQLPRLSIRTIG